MCDTLYLRSNGVGWFAKNSDREPDEPQAMVWLPPEDTGQRNHAPTTRATYVEIPFAPRKYGVLLSQPSWIWGGEIGVNSRGVAIGNEAVFSKMVDRTGSALLGMDLLRLGLERGGTAREALDTIVFYLEHHGQGGPAGYRNKGFRYDNSFLIADANEAWVLETASRMWAARKVGAWAISNCYSLGTEFDLCSKGLPDEAKRLGLWSGRGDFHMAKAFDTRLYPFVGGAHRRRALNMAALACGLEPGWAAMATRLRDHGQHGDDFAAHDNRQVCLHADSFLRPSQTTASLIARLAQGGDTRVAATGTSAPCLGLFEPLPLGPAWTGSAVVTSGSAVADSPWARFEPVHQRALFDAPFRQSLCASRDALESQLFAMAQEDQASWGTIGERANAWRTRWAQQAAATPWRGPGRLGTWWRKHALRELAKGQDRWP